MPIQTHRFRPRPPSPSEFPPLFTHAQPATPQPLRGGRNLFANKVSNAPVLNLPTGGLGGNQTSYNPSNNYVAPGLITPDKPQWWFYAGLLYPIPSGQLTSWDVPAGATNYPSLWSYLAGQAVPQSAYVGAPCSATDMPMIYFNNGEGSGGLAVVYATLKMSLYATTILAQLWRHAGMDIRNPPPATTGPVVSNHIQALSPEGTVNVTLQYLLLAPKPYDQTEAFWDYATYTFF